MPFSDSPLVVKVLNVSELTNKCMQSRYLLASRTNTWLLGFPRYLQKRRYTQEWTVDVFPYTNTQAPTANAIQTRQLTANSIDDKSLCVHASPAFLSSRLGQSSAYHR